MIYSPEEISRLQDRVDTINNLLDTRNWQGSPPEHLLRERRGLYRIIHNIPTFAQLPLDWKPCP